ncbi:hypothetical protein SAMN05421759_1356 [Roseivivax lentus]|uniref:Uncharacterized protein n=1 Tax=Roseivivax lentus TaxID=633194 RepID=A0A1N7Q7M4_9RHOB|nr:hypothetical protein [Roseivivax lentus]SIT18816.1 hypothetical protein SAMN05421759_1356 [Roseivivax lentus]
MTHSPTARLIADAIDASGKTQREIAEEIGFPRGNVISMLRSGEMRLPIERAPGVPPLKWSTNWDRFVPMSGGPSDGWKARQARRDCAEAAAG